MNFQEEKKLKSDFYKNWYKIQKNDQGTSGREQSRRTDW